MDARSTPAWMLDEVAHAGRENLDAAHVDRYDSKEDAHGAAEVALLQSLGLGGQSTIIEFGVGTGQFALAAARACERVIAVDVSRPCRFTVETADYETDVTANYVLRKHSPDIRSERRVEWGRLLL